MTGPRAALIALALVAGCASPLDRCINAATRDIRVLDRLIAETEASLARGYGYQDETVVRWDWVRCDDTFPGPPLPGARRCWEPYETTIRKPVAIDPEAEARKLAALKARRAALAEAAAPKVAACRAAHPEG